MGFQETVKAAQIKFPQLQIAYKDQSTLMRIIGKILFFNPKFMTDYTTTLGSKVYFPSQTIVAANNSKYSTLLLHELVHIYDANRLSRIAFSLSYLCPQILVLLCLPLFLWHWFIALPLILLFLSPVIPAYFRMIFERRAYFAMLYCINILSKKYPDGGFSTVVYKTSCVTQFKSSTYYFMFPYSYIDNQFNIALATILAGQRPFDENIFDTLDELVQQV